MLIARAPHTVHLFLTSLVIGILVMSVGCADDDLAAIKGAVQGRACDDDSGQPLVLATLTLQHNTDGSRMDTTTDGDGAFTFSGVRAGVAGVYVRKPDGALRMLEANIRAGETTSISDPACRDLPPAPDSGAVEGEICNRHTGDMVTNAAVTIEVASGTLTTSTDDAGHFSLADVPVGEHALTVAAAGFQRSYLVTVADAATFHLAAGDDCRSTSLEQGALFGTLCVPAARITAVDAAGNLSQDVSDIRGEFFLGGMTPGETTVVVERAGDPVRNLVATVTAGAETRVIAEVIGQCDPTDDDVPVGEEGEGEDDIAPPPPPPGVPPPTGDCVDGHFPPGTFGTEFECYGFSVATDQVYVLDRVAGVATPICDSPGGLGPIEAFAINPVTGNSYIVAQDTADFGKFIPRSGTATCIYTAMGTFPSSAIGGFAFSRDGVLYAGEEGSGTLWRFAQDPVTKDPLPQYTEIGALPGSSEGLAIHPTSGLAYSSDGSTLAVVDLDAPGSPVFSCSLGDSGFESIFFDVDGTLYSTNNATNQFVRIDVNLNGGGCSTQDLFTAAPELEGSDCNTGGACDNCVCQ